MSEPKRRDYVTWDDVGVMLDHMRNTHGLVGTVEFFRAEDKHGKSISKAGISWTFDRLGIKESPLPSQSINWPNIGWKSVPGLLIFIGHRDEDLWIRIHEPALHKQNELPF